jgi:U3 small nucleolar RNA-associated protein 20
MPWPLKTEATLSNLCLSEWHAPTYVPTPVADLYYHLYRLMKAILHDLRSTITPVYTVLLKRLVPLLVQKLEPVALAELLATLVALFKYVLMPTLPSSLLGVTWNELRQPFENCDDEGRRMLGEVWGAALRRMKPDQRGTCVALMLDGLKSNTSLRDGIAWATVAACRVRVIFIPQPEHYY